MWNTKITIRRNTTSDPREMISAGTEAISYSGVPAILIESDRQSFIGSSTQQRTIRKANLRVLASTDIRVNDRIEDETTGFKYVVDEVVSPSVHLPMNLGIRCRIRRS